MKRRGIGIASIFYGTGYGNGFPDVSKAEAELQRDGRVVIYTGATDVGQGAKTVLSQIAAEALGISVNEITFICEDTSITPDAGTAAASRQTYNTGNAVKKAALNLREEIIKSAVDALGLNSEVGMDIQEGCAYVKLLPEKRITFKEIAALKKTDLLRLEGVFTAQTTQMDAENGQGAPYWPYTFGAYGVEVEVDDETGKVDVIRAVCAQDAGRAINPQSIEGQIDGGFSMGLGYAIYEELKVTKGEIKNNRFAKYLIPTALDMPDIQKVIVESPESSAPYGAKGIGEPVTIGVAPAILNAIYNAVGVRMTETPVTPEKLLKALKDKKAKEGFDEGGH